MSSWHLNRNAFTANLKELADTGPKKDDDRWTIVMRDVVRADDLSFANRLSNDVEKNCKDAVAKKAMQDIVTSLENATKDEEKTRTESILGIMCLADQATRKESTGLDSVVRVVNEMATHLKKPEEGDWKSISDRLHGLPVCRKVEKPLLLHKGEYTITDIIEDAHADILSNGAILGELIIPLGDESSPAKPEDVKKHVKQIVGAMTEATTNLKSLVKKNKSFNDVTGKKNENQILYATMRLLGDTAMAITPILDLEEVKEQVKDVTPDGAWGKKLLQSLEKTADVLRSFGAPVTEESATSVDGNQSASTQDGSVRDGTIAEGNDPATRGEPQVIEPSVPETEDTH
ncbi:hypothetical protein FRC00_003955 [Tulasnella sp. 408]|nr:hypothetical protein FRC00_003955 [Tulasnella sp. 408]